MKEAISIFLFQFLLITSYTQEIFKAVRTGDLEMVISLIQEDSTLVNSRNNVQWTPLHVAVSGSQKEISEILIKNGADINAKDKFQFTPLHRGMYNTTLDVIELLVNNRADLNALNIDEVTALSMAIDFEKTEIVELIVVSGADLDIVMREDETVLHHAAETGNGQIISSLLSHGAKINSKKEYDITALHIASVYGHDTAVQLLIDHGADVNSWSEICGTPLHQAYAGGHLSVAKLLKTNGAIESNRSFPKLEGEYLGEEKPVTIPLRFATKILKNIHRWVTTPTFSPDGKEVFWSASAPHNMHSRIWHMTQNEGYWTAPSTVSFTDGSIELNPFYSPSGTSMIFISDEEFSGADRNQNDRDFWIVDRKHMEWGKPKNLGPPVNTIHFESHATISLSGVLYFFGSYGDGKGDIDLYAASPDRDGYRMIQSLEGNLITRYPEAEPAIAPDESYLVFVSQRPENLTFFDLYVSYRNQNHAWSEAINMGKDINQYNCRNPKISPDGKYLFFQSDDDRNIYWVDTKIIDNLRPKY